MKIKIVIGGKWFDKVNGNTYFNRKIIDGRTGEVTYSGYEYGYGTAYLHTAREMFPEDTIIDGGRFYLKKSDLKNNNF